MIGNIHDRHLPLGVITLLCGLAAMTHAHAASVDTLEAGLKHFRDGTRSWNFAAFTNAAALFSQAAEVSPDSRAAHYWRGTALFHAVLHRMADGNQIRADAVAADLAHDALQALEQAVRLDAADAESHALIATLTGMLISANPFAAFRHGRTVMRHRHLALEAGPANPRVHYLIGTSQYHAPRLLGSRDDGMAALKQAAALFTAEQTIEADPGAPRWGHAHCLAFIGRLYQDQRDKDNAMRYYREALALNPELRMAKEGLKQCLHDRMQGP